MVYFKFYKMRRKFIENYSFFKMLEELSALPDKMYSEPYFFKSSSNIDSFLVFQRFEVDGNDEYTLPHFTITFNCQAAGTRRQKNCSYTLFVYNLDYSVFRESLLKFHFIKIQNFLAFLSGFDKEFYEKLEAFTQYFETYKPTSDYVII